MSEARFDPVAVLTERFVRAIRAALPEFGGDVDPLIGASKRADLGDFQSNAAMGLAKQVGKSPREVAAAIVEKLDVADIAEPVSIAGPGFINVTLRADALAGLLANLDTPALGIEPASRVETVVVDLCGVNLAKQMHVGHLRATVIGDALARVFERLGEKVIRQNHVGDWGLPIAMVVRKVMDESAAGRIDLDALTLDELDRLYKEAQADCAADGAGLAAVRRYGLGPKAEAELEAQTSGAEEALARAKETLVKLQRHEPDVFAMWQRIADVTMTACLATCARLKANVTPEHSAGESSYAKELGEIVADLDKRGVAEESDGALVVRVEGIEEPVIIRKKDGGFLYATTDIAGIRRRVQTLGGDRVIYCVDARQSLHFRQVFGAAIKAGYATKPGRNEPSRLEHAAFGMVLGDDHRPYKTRSGENVKLSDLIDEAVRRAGRTVREKNPGLEAGEQREIAEAVGVAAIKYADLSSERIRDYVFDFDRMLSFEGNTGPYLLYALVRIKSIFRRAEAEGITAGWEDARLIVEAPEEKGLALALLRYPATMQAVADSLEPHRLCMYLYDLATTFSGFFDRCPVIKAETEERRVSRLRLCAIAARVLEDGLHALGIPTLERM
jgi:arginyl-tRNA synthetase